MWYAYAILCDDGSIYKGHTDNLNRRYSEHCTGNGAQHTKKHKPVKFVYTEEFATLEEAVSKEKWLKSGIGREFLKEVACLPQADV